MHTLPECVGCLFAQLNKMVKLHGIDPLTHEKMVKELASKIPEMDLSRTPPELSRTLSDILIKHLGNNDPYIDIKRKENERAKSMLAHVRKIIEENKDSLAMAVKFAAAANVIDYGVPDLFELEHNLENLSDKKFSAFDIELLRRKVNQAKSILVIGDNTGEVFFDRLLIEQLPKDAKIIYAVRSMPVINDVLLDDAKEARIDELADVMESGSHIPGTMPSSCSKEFKDIYQNADVILSKGQGNFETLSDENRPIFFLFAVKCQAVERQIGHAKGSLMAMATPSFKWLD
jgi:uncharacterized protein with ATP-grasp and redox domains